MKKETIVLSLGGSIIIPGKIDINFLKKFRKLILSILPQYQKIIIVTGGGKIARDYQKAVLQITKVSIVDLDWVGIAATKMNAELIRTIFGQRAYPRVAYDPHKKVKTNKKIIIGCGFVPGSSSDLDALVLAKNFGAKTLINLSNIEYIYNKDPRKFKEARPIKKINWSRFFEIVGRGWKPGKNAPFDPVAGKLAQKLGIKVVVMKGTNLENLNRFLQHKNSRGTTIG